MTKLIVSFGTQGMEYILIPGICGILGVFWNMWNIWNIYEKIVDYIPQYSKNFHAFSKLYQLNSKFVGIFGILWNIVEYLEYVE